MAKKLLLTDRLAVWQASDPIRHTGMLERMEPMKKMMAVLLVSLLPGCGGSDSPAAPPPVTNPPAPSEGVFRATVSPNPIIAVPCAGLCGGFDFLAASTVTVTESAGLSGNVDFINVTMRSAATGTEIGTLNFGASEIKEKAGTNDVEARGSLSIPAISIVYRLSGGSRQATLTYAIKVTDKRGNIHNLVVAVEVV